MASSGMPPTGSSQLATMKLNDTKAGMEGLDTEKINQIIEEASKGSKFYAHKKQRQEKIDERIKHMLDLIPTFTPEQLSRAEKQMDELASQLELRRDLSRFIVHIDMDAFYAAVEMRDRPELRDVPMAVGGMGMLSTSNYAARKFGVRAAMPGFIGRKLCPQLVIVPCNFDKYRAASERVQDVLARYDPNFSMMSLDEAYLDITERVWTAVSAAGDDSERMEDDAEPTEDEVARRLVRQMRAEICEATQLTASAGIACNGMLAKICSDQNKPDGQFFLPRSRDAVLAFLESLPVRKVSGVGNVLAQQLAALDVARCGQLRERRALLRLLFSESTQEFLLRAALGVGAAAADPGDERHQKSVSTETTFRDTADAARLAALLRELCDQVAADLRRKRLRGRTVTLKVKTSAFAVRTRAESLPEPTDAAERVLAAARPALARELAAGEPLRLLGVRLSALVPAEEGDGRRQATLVEMAGRGAAASDLVCPICGGRSGSLSELADHVERCLDGGAAEDRPSGAGAGAGASGSGSDRRTDDGAAQGRPAADQKGGASLVAWATDADGGLPPSSTADGSCRRTSMTLAGGTRKDGNPPAPLKSGGGEGTTPVRSSGGCDGRASQGRNESAGRGVGESSGAVAEPAVDLPPAAATCPVCSRHLPEALDQVNRHLDECLNRQLLSELTDGAEVRGTKRRNGPAPASTLKHKRIDEFFRAK